MSSLTIEKYLMGRDKLYPGEFTVTIEQNAYTTVAAGNELLDAANLDREYTSGWRPLEINSKTHGSSVNSKHITAEAGDLEDKDGKLAAWCLANQNILKSLGIYIESPDHTPGWLHYQIVGPKSGRTVFIP